MPTLSSNPSARFLSAYIGYGVRGRRHLLVLQLTYSAMLRAALLTLACLYSTHLPVAAQATGATRDAGAANLKRDFPVLVNRVGATQPADFVIAVDRSGSMKSFWSLVKQGVASFIEAVPDGDYVSVVGFGDGASDLLTPRPVNSQTRAELMREVGNLSEPKEANTDLGKGMERTLDELNRPNGSRLKFVFIFSDFAHDPLMGSPYYRQHSAQSAPWRVLATRRANEQMQSVVQTYALLLPLGGDVGRDIGLARSVFPNLETVNINTATLLPWFERRKAEIARDKLRAIVKQDIERSPLVFKSIERRGDQLVALFELITDRVVETQTINNITAADIRLATPSSRVATITARPPDTPAVSGSASSSTSEARTIEVPVAIVDDRFASWQWSEDNSASFKVTGTQSLAPADEITRLNLPATRDFEVTVDSAGVTARGGFLTWWMVALGVFAIVVIAFIILRRLRTEYIVGEFVVLAHGAKTLTLRDKRTTFEIGATDIGKGIPIQGALWQLLFESFRSGKKGRGVYVKVKGGAARMTLDGQAKDISLTDLNWEQITRGSNTIEIDGKTVQYK